MSAKNKDVKEKNKVKLTERIAITFRKQWLMSGLITILLVLVIISLFMSFIAFFDSSDKV